MLILMAGLIFIGPQKLPELAKSIGKAMGDLNRAATDFTREMTNPVKDIKAQMTDPVKDIKAQMTNPVTDLKKSLTSTDPPRSPAQIDAAEAAKKDGEKPPEDPYRKLAEHAEKDEEGDKDEPDEESAEQPEADEEYVAAAKQSLDGEPDENDDDDDDDELNLLEEPYYRVAVLGIYKVGGYPPEPEDDDEPEAESDVDPNTGIPQIRPAAGAVAYTPTEFPSSVVMEEPIPDEEEPEA